MTDKSYGERVLDNIMGQCERRGIPVEESGSFLAHIAKEAGTQVVDMDAGQLRRLQQGLDGHFRSYLDGRRRRAGFAPETWAEGASGAALVAAAQAGIAIGDVDGTGRGGAVTVKDVKNAAKEE